MGTIDVIAYKYVIKCFISSLLVADMISYFLFVAIAMNI
jgi:hypothetical protein